MTDHQRRRPTDYETMAGEDYDGYQQYPTRHAQQQQYQQQYQRRSRPYYRPPPQQYDSDPPIQALFRSAQRWMSGGGGMPESSGNSNSLGMGVALLAILLFQFR
eukprot:CAMPEP_0197446554 /NCGR_PEP_ID=MMETSP1175-20131217/11484_1 /TAXON_ID=1003142 /ORGANISM="Triceratium dubium, Strain CCMP147" /LENGTH=103 /DNA_ID=CAMNT_0042977697 /DNA_START=208 /DNA_END=516 /DNA_ORIENTATION=+